jgi:hypothetical protein
MLRRHGAYARKVAAVVSHRCASSICTACIRGCSRAGQQDSGRAAGSRNRMMRRCARSACSRVSAAGAPDVYAATATRSKPPSPPRPVLRLVSARPHLAGPGAKPVIRWAGRPRATGGRMAARWGVPGHGSAHRPDRHPDRHNRRDAGHHRGRNHMTADPLVRPVRRIVLLG